MWPENVPIWDAWLAMENQWRVSEGMNGGRYLGLLFSSIPEALDMAGVKKRDRRRVKQGLRYMEGEALAVLNGTPGQ